MLELSWVRQIVELDRKAFDFISLLVEHNEIRKVVAEAKI